MRRRPVQKCDCRHRPTFIVYVLEEECQLPEETFDEQSDSDPLDGDRDSVQAVEAAEEAERRRMSDCYDDGLCGTYHQDRTYGYCACDEEGDNEVVKDEDDPV